MRAFVTAIDAVDLKLADEALIDVSVNFSSEVATSCHFGVFPDWIMLAVTIEGRGRGRSPSKRLLATMAKEFAAVYPASTSNGPAAAAPAAPGTPSTGHP